MAIPPRYQVPGPPRSVASAAAQRPRVADRDESSAFGFPFVAAFLLGGILIVVSLLLFS